MTTATPTAAGPVPVLSPNAPQHADHARARTPQTAMANTVLPDVPVPADQAGIDLLRGEIDVIDAQLIELVQRRTALSNAIGTARKTLGGPRIVYSREMAVLERFRPLGPAGTDFGMLLLAMGRGQMGRR